MENRHCRNCGHELKMEDRFCPSCGGEIVWVEEPPKSEPEWINKGGGSVVTQEFLLEQQKAKELADAKGQMYYGCGILVAIVIFVGLYFLGYR